jgi:hypothetical protein
MRAVHPKTPTRFPGQTTRHAIPGSRASDLGRTSAFGVTLAHTHTTTSVYGQAGGNTVATCHLPCSPVLPTSLIAKNRVLRSRAVSGCGLFSTVACVAVARITVA